MNLYNMNGWVTSGHRPVITLNNNWTHDIRAPVALRIFPLDVNMELS